MICIAWNELPQYGARCIGAFVASTDDEVVVVATRPRVPIKGMEDACKCRIVWIGTEDQRTLGEIVGCNPHVLVVSGWGTGVFNRFRDEVHARGDKVIAMCDNNWMGWSIREFLKAIRFRLKLRDKYHGFFVPGKSGIKLLKAYGVKESRIATGLYSADASLFTNGRPLAERPKTIIYVGQFIERKNVRRLIQAFQSLDSPDWKLEMYGAGPLHDEIECLSKNGSAQQGKIAVYPFVQPEQLAKRYQSARIFILPSLSEHWGLVVHEAALSGCVLLVGNHTGATEDLLGLKNGFTFDPYSIDSISGVMDKAMSLSDEELLIAQKESLEKASAVSLDRFANSLNQLVKS